MSELMSPLERRILNQKTELGRLNAALARDQAKLEAAQKANAKDRHMRDALYGSLLEMLEVSKPYQILEPVKVACERAREALLLCAGVTKEEFQGLSSWAAK